VGADQAGQPLGAATGRHDPEKHLWLADEWVGVAFSVADQRGLLSRVRRLPHRRIQLPKNQCARNVGRREIPQGE
jgi:hypothetical protein